MIKKQIKSTYRSINDIFGGLFYYSTVTDFAKFLGLSGL